MTCDVLFGAKVYLSLSRKCSSISVYFHQSNRFEILIIELTWQIMLIELDVQVLGTTEKLDGGKCSNVIE